jgi:hypothetical protein
MTKEWLLSDFDPNTTANKTGSTGSSYPDLGVHISLCNLIDM